MTDNGQRTTDNGQRTTDMGLRTTDNGQRTWDYGQRTTFYGRTKRTPVMAPSTAWYSITSICMCQRGGVRCPPFNNVPPFPTPPLSWTQSESQLPGLEEALNWHGMSRLMRGMPIRGGLAEMNDTNERHTHGHPHRHTNTHTRTGTRTGSHKHNRWKTHTHTRAHKWD